MVGRQRPGFVERNRQVLALQPFRTGSVGNAGKADDELLPLPAHGLHGQLPVADSQRHAAAEPVWEVAQRLHPDRAIQPQGSKNPPHAQAGRGLGAAAHHTISTITRS